MVTDGAEETVHRYYAALRAGDPLHPFFADDGTVVKVGVWSRHVGAEAVARELREQTGTTEDWVVESRDLHVGTVRREGEEPDEGDVAWFGDRVFVGWTDVESGVSFEFETRWTATMVRREEEWRFVSMHVSTPDET